MMSYNFGALTYWINAYTILRLEILVGSMRRSLQLESEELGNAPVR